jgi:hypothetical protein
MHETAQHHFIMMLPGRSVPLDVKEVVAQRQALQEDEHDISPYTGRSTVLK